MFVVPHPIPYQGSKRKLASKIDEYIPKNIDVFYEPFAGSAAMTIYMASHNRAKKYVIGDSLSVIIDLWEAIINHPDETAERYRKIWEGQGEENQGYFNEVRARYNEKQDPVDLLYLICRCVKNAVRFNASGHFTQSHDKRRKGTQPHKMAIEIKNVSTILKGKVEFRRGDWLETVNDAKPTDFVYMDPPYLGTSAGKDKRYHQQLLQEPLVQGLKNLNSRNIRFALSYDGMTGGREYGPPLPDFLSMKRLLLNAGRSSQSTLHGKDELTLESLYLSDNIAKIETKTIA